MRLSIKWVLIFIILIGCFYSFAINNKSISSKNAFIDTIPYLNSTQQNKDSNTPKSKQYQELIDFFINRLENVDELKLISYDSIGRKKAQTVKIDTIMNFFTTVLKEKSPYAIKLHQYFSGSNIPKLTREQLLIKKRIDSLCTLPKNGIDYELERLEFDITECIERNANQIWLLLYYYQVSIWPHNYKVNYQNIFGTISNCISLISITDEKIKALEYKVSFCELIGADIPRLSSAYEALEEIELSNKNHKQYTKQYINLRKSIFKCFDEINDSQSKFTAREFSFDLYNYNNPFLSNSSDSNDTEVYTWHLYNISRHYIEGVTSTLEYPKQQTLDAMKWYLTKKDIGSFLSNEINCRLYYIIGVALLDEPQANNLAIRNYLYLSLYYALNSEYIGTQVVIEIIKAIELNSNHSGIGKYEDYPRFLKSFSEIIDGKSSYVEAKTLLIYTEVNPFFYNPKNAIDTINNLMNNFENYSIPGFHLQLLREEANKKKFEIAKFAASNDLDEKFKDSVLLFERNYLASKNVTKDELINLYGIASNAAFHLNDTLRAKEKRNDEEIIQLRTSEKIKAENVIREREAYIARQTMDSIMMSVLITRQKSDSIKMDSLNKDLFKKNEDLNLANDTLKLQKEIIEKQKINLQNWFYIVILLSIGMCILIYIWQKEKGNRKLEDQEAINYETKKKLYSITLLSRNKQHNLNNEIAPMINFLNRSDLSSLRSYTEAMVEYMILSSKLNDDNCNLEAAKEAFSSYFLMRSIANKGRNNLDEFDIFDNTNSSTSLKIKFIPLLFETIFENSLKHGFREKKDICKFTILLSTTNDKELLCVLIDNGIAPSGDNGYEIKADRGLDLLKRRIHLNWLLKNRWIDIPQDYFVIEKGKNEIGTKIFLKLPYEEI